MFALAGNQVSARCQWCIVNSGFSAMGNCSCKEDCGEPNCIAPMDKWDDPFSYKMCDPSTQ